MSTNRGWLLLVVLLLASSVQATDYYVDSTGGNDSNAGTSTGTAWQNLSKVNGFTFAAGDTINFRRGRTWTGTSTVNGSLQLNGNGTSGARITAQAYDSGALPIIRGGSSRPTSGFTRTVVVYGDYWTVKDLEVTNAHEGCIAALDDIDNLVVQGNTVHDCGLGVLVARNTGALITQNTIDGLFMVVNDAAPNTDYGANGIWIQAHNVEASYNTVTDAIATSIDFGNDGGCFEIFDRGDNAHLHHNVCLNVWGLIEFGGSAGTAQGADNVWVHHNKVYTQAGTSCMHVGGGFALAITNPIYENNTIVTHASNSTRMFSCDMPTGMVLRNNIFHSNTQIAGSAPATHTHNSYYMSDGDPVGFTLGTGELTSDPLFVSLGTQDYHLQSGSPARNAGTSLGYTVDLDGISIPQGAAPDMGAYEFVEAAGTVPTILRVVR